MAGIYVHIPFCKQACTYCDFHFSTSMAQKGKVVEAILHEMKLRRDFLDAKPVNTLYFGGGTPSVLSKDELRLLMNDLNDHFEFSPNYEFTFEANPDDLSIDKIRDLKAAGVNRLSIGIQSFNDSYLRWMNRAHTAVEGLTCVAAARKAGIRNISIDLIYGLPGLSINEWKAELQKALTLGITHISAYCLTVEPKTALGRLVRTRKEQPVDEAAAAEQFRVMISELEKGGFEQYEVSNFAIKGYYSKHNTSYWRGLPYLGLGPSAHSFAPGFREWNVANNMRYLRAIETGELPLTREDLTLENRINEWIMTGLRTKWGIDLKMGREVFGIELWKQHASYIEKLISEGDAVMEATSFRLTPKGLFLADGIASELFVVA